MGRYRKVNPGDAFRPSASLTNATIDLVSARENDNGGGGQAGGGSGVFVLVENTSGSDCDQLEVLGIDGITFTPADNTDAFANGRVIVKGVTPSRASHLGKFVVCADPIKNGEIGWGYIDGLCPAKVEVGNDGHEWVEVRHNDRTKLDTGWHGSARIIYKDASSGTANALIQMGAPSPTVIPCKVVSSSQDSGNKRWAYTLKPQKKSGATWAGWSDYSGAPTITAYNGIEAPNTTSGTYGNGVSQTNLSATPGYDLVPLGAGAIVMVSAHYRADTGAVEYWFNATNQVDGSCE